MDWHTVTYCNEAIDVTAGFNQLRQEPRSNNSQDGRQRRLYITPSGTTFTKPDDGCAVCPVEPTKIVSRRSKFPLWEYVAPASTTDIKRRQHMTWDHNKTIKTSPATSRKECVARHTHGSEWIRMRGIATRVVSPVSKLVNPQHVQPVHLKGHGPNEKKRQDHEEGRK